jgi:hypothetical protein
MRPPQDCERLLNDPGPDGEFGPLRELVVVGVGGPHDDRFEVRWQHRDGVDEPRGVARQSNAVARVAQLAFAALRLEREAAHDHVNGGDEHRLDVGELGRDRQVVLDRELGEASAWRASARARSGSTNRSGNSSRRTSLHAANRRSGIFGTRLCR